MSRTGKSVEARLRDLAASETRAKIRQAADAASEDVGQLLRTLAARFLDAAFDVNALRREHDVRDNNVSAWFAAEVGKTPKAYLTECRLQVTAWYLVWTKVPVGRVSKLCGFANRNAFTCAFRGFSGGLVPREYRLRHGRVGFDAAEVERALSGELDVQQGRAFTDRLRGMCAQLGALYDADVPVLTATDRALAAADYEAALACLRDAEDADAVEVVARFAVAWHGRGAVRAVDGDVDRAFVDLVRAREAYAAAGELPEALCRRRRHPERLGVSCDTDDALLDALCPVCRDALTGDAGRSLRGRLRRRAQELLPRGLEWFRTACDDCYRVVWRAVSAARLGLLDDAFEAVWLRENAESHLGDPKSPASRGRVIAWLARVEAGVHGDQDERCKLCELALTDAEALGDPKLVAEVRTWRANVFRARGELVVARSELVRVKTTCQASPWLAALHRRMEGLLEDSASNYREALRLAREAAELYGPLDPHLAGVMKVHEANALFYLGEHEKAIEQDLSALVFLDERRDPIGGPATVSIHLGSSYGSLGLWEQAELAISHCRYDREACPGLAASEVFTWGCLKLGQSRALEALGDFAEAGDRFEALHRPRAAALATSYSVEANAELGDRAGALENAAAAARFFEAAGCARDTLEAVSRLQALLESEALDVQAIRAVVRRLCRENGGWLPET